MVAVARQRRERGQGIERDVHAQGAGAVAPLPDAFEERRGQGIGRHQPRIKQFRIDVRGHVFRADALAVVEDDTDGTILLHDHLANAGPEADLDAVAGGGARHRLRDRAHAADRVSPHAFPAVHFAEGMVQHDIGGAGGIRTGVVADDGVEPEQRLDEIVREGVVQHLARRTREQIEQQALIVQRQPAENIGRTQRVEAFTNRAGAEAIDKVGRRPQHELAEHVGDGFELRREAVVAIGIAGVELFDGGPRAAFAREQIAAIRRWQEILRAPLDDPQPVIVQAQVGDDLRIEQADGIGGDRIAEAGVEFLGHRRAADHAAPLDHADPQAVHRQIGGAGQAVVARANDDNVGSGFAHCFRPFAARPRAALIVIDPPAAPGPPLSKDGAPGTRAPGP